MKQRVTGPLVSVSVVVPMRDARRYLKTCLTSVVRATEKVGAEVVVVDNCSQDGSLEAVRDEFGKDVRLLSCVDGGISATRNLGASATSGDVLVFLDADCEVPENFLAEVQEVFVDPDIAAAGCKYSLPVGARWLERAWHEIHFTAADGPVKYLPGGNLSVRRDAFAEVSGFDEELRTGEDADLCQRITRQGRLVVQRRRLIAIHHGNAKSLVAFYRKQRWHAVGMTTTVRRGELDLPFIASLLHAACCVAAVVGFWHFRGTKSIAVALGAVLVVNLMPVLAVVWRRRSAERVTAASALGGVLLYQVYFLARISVLVRGVLQPRRERVRRA